MDYEQIKSYLYGLINYGSTYGIDRMRLLAQIIKNPERTLPIIHVAGTNGKGSVCAMLEAIYRKNSYKTGLFTSPHLVRLEERIQIDRQPISEQEFIHYIEHIKNTLKSTHFENDELRPSFFEILNATGFLHFSKQQIDIGIIETGLGGRFDSTNIVNPLVSIITTISHDHTEILGESLASIAMAKAGIIKPETPVVIGLMTSEAEAVIRKVAQEQNSPVFSVEEAYGKNFSNYPLTTLQGTYQRHNAATAVLASKVIKSNFPVDDQTSQEALKNVDWPGRWQSMHIGENELILDCAHNEAGAKGLAENLEHLIKQKKQKPIIIVGVLGTYRAKAIIPIVSQYAETIILVKPNNPKAIDANTLRNLIPNDFGGSILEESIQNLFPSPSICTLQTRERSIVATGSIYLIGEIMGRVKK